MAGDVFAAPSSFLSKTENQILFQTQINIKYKEKSNCKYITPHGGAYSSHHYFVFVVGQCQYKKNNFTNFLFDYIVRFTFKYISLVAKLFSAEIVILNKLGVNLGKLVPRLVLWNFHANRGDYTEVT